jgi:hypothetical protein
MNGTSFCHFFAHPSNNRLFAHSFSLSIRRPTTTHTHYTLLSSLWQHIVCDTILYISFADCISANNETSGIIFVSHQPFQIEIYEYLLYKYMHYLTVVQFLYYARLRIFRRTRYGRRNYFCSLSVTLDFSLLSFLVFFLLLLSL